METIDAPIDLCYKTGKLFPNNAVFLGYVFLPIGVFAIAVGSAIIGLALLLLGAIISFSSTRIIFSPELSQYVSQTRIMGFIPFSKSHTLSNWELLTVIPIKVSETVYANAAMSNTQSNFFFTVNLMKASYRGKKELLRFESKVKAEEVAKGLCHRLGKSYFEYDPKVVRDAFRK